MEALSDYEDGLHSCGRHMSESLRLLGRPDPEYVVGQRVCLACKELDATQAGLAKKWEQSHKDGRHPERYTLLNVYTKDEAKAIAQKQGTQTG